MCKRTWTIIENFVHKKRFFFILNISTFIIMLSRFENCLCFVYKSLAVTSVSCKSEENNCKKKSNHHIVRFIIIWDDVDDEDDDDDEEKSEGIYKWKMNIWFNCRFLYDFPFHHSQFSFLFVVALEFYIQVGKKVNE